MISVEEAKNLYRFQTRVAKFKENFKNGYVANACPLCLVQPDTQAHSLQDIPQDISETLLEISPIVSKLEALVHIYIRNINPASVDGSNCLGYISIQSC